MALFQTGDNSGAGTVTFTLLISDELWFKSALIEAIRLMTIDSNWAAQGSVDPFDAARAASQAFITYRFRAMIGQIVPGLFATAPDGYLVCDGSTHNRADYPELWDVLDPAYKLVGEQFTVPDLRDLTIIGASVERPINQVGGAAEHTLTVDEMPSHSHAYSGAITAVDLVDVGAPLPGAAVSPLITDTAGGNQPHNNMPPYLALNYYLIAR